MQEILAGVPWGFLLAVIAAAVYGYVTDTRVPTARDQERTPEEQQWHDQHERVYAEATRRWDAKTRLHEDK